ncbi:MAG TPA: hypothetical protein P5026_01330 [Kiritimatiellia bacterium]|nr:hypothetical protein [Kiritimatiellia bacterium]HRU69760.1 hypothetical protein [Kiritimatiellia bacterium]
MGRELWFGAIAALMLTANAVIAAELWIGAAETDITPDRPVALDGNKTGPIARSIKSRCRAEVLALEAREQSKPTDAAILVVCDLVRIRPGVQAAFRAHVASHLPGFDINKLFLAATHTHCAPVTAQDEYDGYGDAMQPKEYVSFLFGRLTDAAVKAWQERQPGTFAWGLGHAVIAQGRRTVHKDGSAVMYGSTSRADFRHLEGGVDQAVDALYFLDAEKKMKAVVLTAQAPAQSGGGTHIDADYWHWVREGVRQRHGQRTVVLGFIAPSGNQVPRCVLRKGAEERMIKLKGVSWTREIGERVVRAVDDVWQAVSHDLRSDVVFSHRVECFDLPGRKVTEDEYCAAQKKHDELNAKAKLVGGDYWEKRRAAKTLARYEAQKIADPAVGVEMHVIRLEDVVIATNPFELYPEYGVRILGRSPAGQTVLLSFASPLDESGYMATREATKAGGYSALVESCPVGHEGGQIFVDRTVEAIKKLFLKK